MSTGAPLAAEELGEVLDQLEPVEADPGVLKAQQSLQYRLSIAAANQNNRTRTSRAAHAQKKAGGKGDEPEPRT